MLLFFPDDKILCGDSNVRRAGDFPGKRQTGFGINGSTKGCCVLEDSRHRGEVVVKFGEGELFTSVTTTESESTNAGLRMCTGGKCFC